MNKTVVTMTDVARLAGVSQSSVSMILNNKKSVSFSQKTIDKVHDAAQQLGYEYSHIHLRRSSSYRDNILVLTATLTNPYYPMLFSSLDRAAQPYNMQFVTCDTYHNPIREEKYLQMALDCRFSAVVFCYTPANTEAVSRFNAFYPIISLCDYPYSVGDQLYLNSQESGMIAARYLLSIGHSCIAVLSSDTSLRPSRRARIDGVRQAMNEAGLSEKLIVIEEKAEDISPLDIDADYRIGRKLAHRRDFLDCPGTAIIAINDMTAIGIIDGLQEQGYKVPADYSVVGFDNQLYSRFSRVALTTIDNHMNLMMQSLVQLLLYRLHPAEGGKDNPASLARMKIECMPRLVLRSTTAEYREKR